MVALYLRVSTQEQAKEGYSIGEQENRLKTYCMAMEWQDIKVYTDAGYSGANLNRPALSQLLSDIKSGLVDRVVVYKIDRLTRSVRNALEIVEDVFIPSGCQLYSVSESIDLTSPTGKMSLSFTAMFAQMERENIKERMAMGRDGRAKEGKYHGGSFAPVGYDYIDGELQVNGYEAEQVKQVFELFLFGIPKRTIARTLNEKGYRHKYGHWSDVRVDRVLRNPIYIGKLPHGGEVLQGIQKPLISEETFEATQSILFERKMRFRGKKSHSATYLGGLIYCKQCGGRYLITRTGKYSYYVCRNRKRHHLDPSQEVDCQNKNWKMEELDNLVLSQVEKLSLDPTFQPQEQERNIEPIRQEISKLEKQKDRLFDLYTNGTIDATEISRRINEITARIKEQEEQVYFITQAGNTAKNAKKAAESFSAVIQSGTLEQVRMILSDLIEQIDLDGEDVEIHWKF